MSDTVVTASAFFASLQKLPTILIYWLECDSLCACLCIPD